MSIHLPLDLLFVYSMLTTAIFVQQDIIRRTEFLGRPTAPVPLQLSAAIGGLVAIGTLIHFFVMTPWYWVFVLVALSSLIAVIAQFVVRSIFGDIAAIVLSYLAWPVCAIWANMLIARLPA